MQKFQLFDFLVCLSSNLLIVRLTGQNIRNSFILFQQFQRKIPGGSRISNAFIFPDDRLKLIDRLLNILAVIDVNMANIRVFILIYIDYFFK